MSVSNQEKKPHIIMKTNENLENDTKIENSTVLEGYNQDYRVSSKRHSCFNYLQCCARKEITKNGILIKILLKKLKNVEFCNIMYLLRR